MCLRLRQFYLDPSTRAPEQLWASLALWIEVKSLLSKPQPVPNLLCGQEKRKIAYTPKSGDSQSEVLKPFPAC